MATTLRFLPGGACRAIWDDDFPFRDYGATPRRASRVEAVADGPHAGEFYVDFSPLGPAYQFCLGQTFARYRDAVAAEVAWLKANWLDKTD